MRKPNVAEAAELYAELANQLRRDGNHAYAAVCVMAVARCEEALANPTGQVERTAEAARLYLQAELQGDALGLDSFEADLADAVHCYLLAVDLHVAAPRNRNRASSWPTRSPRAAPPRAVAHYEKAAALQSSVGHATAAELHALERAADCRVRSCDYAGAAALLSRIVQAALAASSSAADDAISRGPSAAESCERGAMLDYVGRSAVTRVLLTLLLRPSAMADVAVRRDPGATGAMTLGTQPGGRRRRALSVAVRGLSRARCPCCAGAIVPHGGPLLLHAVGRGQCACMARLEWQTPPPA